MQIFFEARCEFPAYLRPRVRRMLARAATCVPQSLAKKIEGFEVSVSIVGEREIRRLNRDFRGKDKVTDVLSFGVLESSAGSVSKSLGDIVICWKRAKEQRHEFHTTIPEELDRLVVHGFLHLLGYDHETGPAEARKMRRLEDKILR